ncbi:MAG: 3'-5' exoribonuclease YhaM family protein [Calditrichia bacterium]
MEKRGLKNLAVGEEYTGFCIIRKIELKHRQSGEPYLSLELGDHSGRLRAKIWDNAENVYSALKVGSVVKVKGKVQLYKDIKEFHIQRHRQAREGEVVLQELVPSTKKDVEAMRERFMAHYEQIGNEFLRELLSRVFPDEQALEGFLKYPSGKLWHHNYLYGILEHLLCLLDLTDVLWDHYPQINKDLLKAGIILKEIGKQRSIDAKGFIDYSTEGRLIGWPVLGFKTVQGEIEKVEDFPESLRLELLHLIISQAGADEENPGILPMTQESIVLQKMEELDNTANAVQRIIEFDRLPYSEWTRFNNLLNRFIYVGNKTDDSGTDEQDE